MSTAPVVLFAYNRPEHTRRTLDALAANTLADQTLLIVYADGPKTNAAPEAINLIRKTREVIRSAKGMADYRIIESSHNKGLARSVIDGVTETIKEFGQVIVLEDDLVTAPGFLHYMNSALEKYQETEGVMQISGYQFPIDFPVRSDSSFFLPFTTSWGWATWKRAWTHFDEYADGYAQLLSDTQMAGRFNLGDSYPYSQMLVQQMEGNNIDSWAIRWYWTVFRHKGLVLFPAITLISNIGFGPGATHTLEHDQFSKPIGASLPKSLVTTFPGSLMANEQAFQLIRSFLSPPSDLPQRGSWKSRIFGKIKSLFFAK